MHLILHLEDTNITYQRFVNSKFTKHIVTPALSTGYIIRNRVEYYTKASFLKKEVDTKVIWYI